MSELQSTRSWGWWFFFGILTGGICLVIYNLLNFMDLDTHDQLYGRKENAPSTQSSAFLMVLLCCFVPVIGSIIVLYIKYDRLNKHLAAYQGAPNCPDGMTMLLLTILISIFSAGIVTLYLEWKWQDVFNQHIRWHNHNERQQVPTR
ncbi:MAG: hypothetical protein ACTSP5_12670 [Candidatus Heimdallarchaeota archaeon]